MSNLIQIKVAELNQLHTIIPLWMLFGYSGQRPVT